jgi:adenylosuccinate lyase
MQPLDKEELKRLIQEAKAENKDTSELEKLLSEDKLEESPKGEILEEKFDKKVWTKTKPKTQQVKRIIISTGPARKEDFE